MADVFCGIDPSSSVTGWAFVSRDAILSKGCFFAEKDAEIHGEMLKFAGDLEELLEKYHPGSRNTLKGMAVEKVSVSWNVNTIRRIAYYEAVAMMLMASYQEKTLRQSKLFQLQATKARRIVLGKGNHSKEKCFELAKQKWGDIFEKPGKGGMDEADAVVLAFAAQALYFDENA